MRAALTELAGRAAADPLFAPLEPGGPKIEVSADGRVVGAGRWRPRTPAGTDEAERSLDELRADLVPATLGGVPGAEYAVGGGVAGQRGLRRRTSGTSCRW